MDKVVVNIETGVNGRPIIHVHLEDGDAMPNAIAEAAAEAYDAARAKLFPRTSGEKEGKK